MSTHAFTLYFDLIELLAKKLNLNDLYFITWNSQSLVAEPPQIQICGAATTRTVRTIQISPSLFSSYENLFYLLGGRQRYGS